MKKIAYFTNYYPKVSHSFIRREILALEKLGYDIKRCAIQCDREQIVDQADIRESEKTKYILNDSILKILFSALKVWSRAPFRRTKILFYALKLGSKSDRGILRHIMYFVEALILLNWQKSETIEHIHCHFGTNPTMVVMLARLMGGVDYSFTVHGPEEFDKPGFIHLGEKIKNSKFVVAISSYCKSQLFRQTDYEQWNKVKIVRCGLDELYINNEVCENSEVKDQLVCIGRLCEQKGQLLLLDAFKIAHDKGLRSRLILAGDGEMRAEIEKRIDNLNLRNVVEVTGWLDSMQVKNFIEESKFMVLPSFAEGLPVVIMESMALGKPVISTYIAGIPELVTSHENGWLVPAGDVDTLSAVLLSTSSMGEEEIKAMGIKAVEKVRQMHDVNIEAEKLSNWFERSSSI